MPDWFVTRVRMDASRVIIHFQSGILEPEFLGLRPTEGDRSCLIVNGGHPPIWTRECKHGYRPEPLDPDVFSVFPHYNE